MDYSKLPKLSQSPPPPDNSAEPGDAASARPTSFCIQCGAPLATGARFCGGCGAPVQGQAESPVLPKYVYPSQPSNTGMEAVVAFFASVILIFLGWNYARYLTSKLSGQPFVTGYVWPTGHALANQPVEYYDLQGGTAYTEGGFFYVGVATFLQGILLLLAMRMPRGQRPLSILAVVLLTAAAMYNGYGIAKVMGMGVSAPLISILSELFVIFNIGQLIYSLARPRPA